MLVLFVNESKLTNSCHAELPRTQNPEPRNQNDQGKIILSKMNSNMLKRNTMPGLVLTLSYENCILADLLWCKSTLMRKTYLILPLNTERSHKRQGHAPLEALCWLSV